MPNELTFKSWKVFDYRKNQGVSATEILTDLLFFAGEDGDIDPKNLAQVASDGSYTIAKEFSALGAEPAFVYFESSDSHKQVGIYSTSWTLEEYMATKWDCDAWGSVAHMLACFDLDPTKYLGEVKPDYVGPVRVWEERSFFAGSLDAVVPDYVRDDLGKHMVFASYAEAQAWIKAKEDVDEFGRVTYHLAGNEYAPSAYTICSS